MKINAWLVVESACDGEGDGTVLGVHAFSHDKPGHDEATALFRDLVIDNIQEFEAEDLDPAPDEEADYTGLMEGLFRPDGTATYGNGTYQIDLMESMTV